MKVYLVRHGKTEFNKLNKIQGWLDSPLLDEDNSYELAVEKLRGIDFSYICSSDLKRAVKTKEKILNALGLKDDKNEEKAFREINYGEFEGLELSVVLEKYKEVWDKYKYQDIDYDPSTVIKGFESVKKVRERFINRILELKKEFGDNANILIVTHGGAINTLVYRDVKLTYYPPIPENGSVTVLEF